MSPGDVKNRFTVQDVDRGRQVFSEVQPAHRRLGLITLEIAPAYESDRRAESALGPYAEALGVALGWVPACRRYAVTEDWRVLQEYAGQRPASSGGA